MSERRHPRPERPPRNGDAVAGRGRGLPVDWVTPAGEEREARSAPGERERAPRQAPEYGDRPRRRQPPPGRRTPPPPPSREDPFAGMDEEPFDDEPLDEDAEAGLGDEQEPFRRRFDGDDGSGREPPRGLPDPGQLVALLDGLRGAVPREVQDQLNTLLRELLLSLRALIDWYLERLDSPRREPEVEDIPID